VSCYEVVESFGDCSLLDVRIKTGRTHQIRVHMAHMGHHIVGDPQYGRRGERKKTGGKADRQMLHSHRLSLKHPFTGRMLNFIAPIPLDMESILFFLRKARVEKSF